MKHIQIVGSALPQHNKVLVTVTAQTHVGRAFGSVFRFDGDSRKFTASNGFTLGSNSFPANDTTNPNIFWVRGTGSAASQTTTVVMSKTKFEKVKVAAQEYNVYFADRAAAPVYQTVASCLAVIG